MVRHQLPSLSSFRQQIAFSLSVNENVSKGQESCVNFELLCELNQRQKHFAVFWSISQASGYQKSCRFHCDIDFNQNKVDNGTFFA
jgi:hypothetical protein